MSKLLRLPDYYYVTAFVLIFMFHGCLKSTVQQRCQNLENIKAPSRSAELEVNDNLPHYRYRQISDSLNRFYINDKINNEGGFANGFGIGFIGAYHVSRVAVSDRQEIAVNYKYLTLEDYYIKEDREFHSQGKTGFMKYYIREHERKTDYGSSYTIKSLPDTMPLAYRYNYREHRLMMPVPGWFFLFYKIMLICVSVLMVLFSIIHIYGRAFRVLLNITRGKPFDSTNISNLYFLGKTFVLAPFIILAIKWVAHLCVMGYLHGDLYFDGWSGFLGNWGWMSLGGVLLILATAFKRGAKIEEENKLTV
jgi:hypothetical protein